MAKQLTAPVTVSSDGISDNRPTMMIGLLGQTLHIWRGMAPLPEIRAIWRNEKGTAACLQETPTP